MDEEQLDKWRLLDRLEKAEEAKQFYGNIGFMLGAIFGIVLVFSFFWFSHLPDKEPTAVEGPVVIKDSGGVTIKCPKQ